MSDSASFDKVDKVLAAPLKTVSAPFYFLLLKFLFLGLQWLYTWCAVVMQASVSWEKIKRVFESGW